MARHASTSITTFLACWKLVCPEASDRRAYQYWCGDNGSSERVSLFGRVHAPDGVCVVVKLARSELVALDREVLSEPEKALQEDPEPAG